nr:hypothetical protein MACL_00002214 [Theileria orientalis]
MVYFCREGEKPKTLCEEHKDDNSIAMLVEFIDSCNSKKFLRRKDKHGYWWEEEPFTYNSDKELTERLIKIRKSVYWSEVYYLKASGNEDIEPFLIVLVPDDKEKKNTKAYHFADKNNFEGWKEFNVETSETLEKKLEEKLEKIDKYCACLSNITTVRWYAHEILIGQEPDPPKPEVPPSPTRPPEVRPPDEPKPLPVWLIVGCVAAGVVLIVTLVVVYGIYWYNTTIKLLT